MCLAKDESPKAEEAQSPRSPRSPWAKLLNRQNLKPRLPRKISTKVNLNKYWSKFGELVGCKPSDADPEPLVLPFSDYFYPVDPIKPSEDADNETNAEIADGNRFEIIPQDGIEVTENFANEVREICYRKSAECFVCNLCC